jgi:chromosome segregation ATPase
MDEAELNRQMQDVRAKGEVLLARVELLEAVLSTLLEKLDLTQLCDSQSAGSQWARARLDRIEKNLLRLENYDPGAAAQVQAYIDILREEGKREV